MRLGSADDHHHIIRLRLDRDRRTFIGGFVSSQDVFRSQLPPFTRRRRHGLQRNRSRPVLEIVVSARPQHDADHDHLDDHQENYDDGQNTPMRQWRHIADSTITPYVAVTDGLTHWDS
ncbi:hypothetical protein GCM10009855_26470 [Gordonia cholesterolivorans]|uniref:Uncharacterized protein n=1 Tax=Gordonia cholesterolivorans TaxID=559625 RepID=A0ABN3HP36_9ACTN